MTAVPSSPLLALVEGREDLVAQALKSTLAISLLLHVFLIGAISIVRFTPTIHRPASSHQVTLVSLPAAVVAREPAPRPAQEPPKATKATKAAPPPPVAKPMEKRTVMLKEMPKAAEPPKPLSPNPDEIRKLLGKLTVPEVPAAPTPAKPAPVQPQPAALPSVAQELESQLQRLQQTPVASTIPAAAPPKTMQPPPTASLKKPTTTINVPGVASGFSQYLTAVQNKISRLWVAPPVDASGGAFEVVIRFRLHRTGAVSDVTVERSSGNEYYDAAGKRAVLAAYPLPPFPTDMTDAYLDAHFSFAIGQPSG